jgi:hypothetical protein
MPAGCGGQKSRVRQTFDLPGGTGTVSYVAPNGREEERGESPARPSTLEAALPHVRPVTQLCCAAGPIAPGT